MVIWVEVSGEAGFADGVGREIMSFNGDLRSERLQLGQDSSEDAINDLRVINDGLAFGDERCT